MRNDLRIIVVVAFAALCTPLSGCPAFIPPLGYGASSRGNVPAQRPDWIVAGTTSRDDVLLTLGTPDAEAVDGSWIGYFSSRHQGSVAVFILGVGSGGGGVGVSNFMERRLVIWFDARGIVTKAAVDEKDCRRVVSDRDARPGSCMGFDDLGEPANYSPGETRSQ